MYRMYCTRLYCTRRCCARMCYMRLSPKSMRQRIQPPCVLSIILRGERPQLMQWLEHCSIICWGIGLMDQIGLCAPLALLLLGHWHKRLHRVMQWLGHCSIICWGIGLMDQIGLYAPLALLLLGHWHTHLHGVFAIRITKVDSTATTKKGDFMDT
jgi:hypothetical protein